MKHFNLFLFGVLTAMAGFGQPRHSEEQFFDPDNPMIEYMGRVDFASPKLPRFANPGVTIRFRYGGAQCRVILHDEVPDDKVHNYLVLILGGDLGVYRVKLAKQTDTLTINGNGRVWMDGEVLPSVVRPSSTLRKPDPHGEHLVTICKATEGIGWVEFEGVYADALLPAPALPDRKIEFIGNSITCGFGNDTSGIPCGQGEWYDQENAWLSYAPVTARALKAQWSLTAVSGIGLIHSCCKMTITMPEVFDRMDPRGNRGTWDFSKYQPDVVTICLGQNDGIQDSATFCGAYVNFVHHLRAVYPQAKIVLLSSPMADAQLKAEMIRYLDAVVVATGDPLVSDFFFRKQWSHGCATHPDAHDDVEIAGELMSYLKGLMSW
jgi:lysophospholipase L1-like esterase